VIDHIAEQFTLNQESMNGRQFGIFSRPMQTTQCVRRDLV
jgi:hypothetical protein